MDLSYTEEQSILRDSALALLGDVSAFEQRQQAIRTPNGFDQSAWKRFAELGWLGWPIAEADGGYGGSLSDVSILAEIMGRYITVEPFLDCVVFAAGLLSELGEGEQRQPLAQIASGDKLVLVAHHEDGLSLATDQVATRADRNGEGWVLNGLKSNIVSGGAADLFLITATLEDGTFGVFLVPADTPGLTVKQYRIVDGRLSADLTMTRLELGSEARLGGRDATKALAKHRDAMIALSCAYIVGALDELLRETSIYTETRVQFGKPLKKLQVVQHRLAEMRAMAEESRATSLLAVLRLQAAPPHRERAVSAAKIVSGNAARFVAQQAVQLHGGMGVSDELKIGTYLKRVTSFQLMLGSENQHLQRYEELMRAGAIDVRDTLPLDAKDEAEGLSVDLTPRLAAFRRDTRAFLEAHLPSEINRAVKLNVAPFYEPSVSRPWHNILHENGRAAPEWPSEHGGADWDPFQQFIWRTEVWRAGAPMISPLALRLVSPIILHYGTEEQKQRFLPDILSGATYWCQGFSEPEAGSDLASLRCAAKLDGEDYVINGTKLWQTHAHYADYSILLARTATTEKRQEGITCLLVDMQSKGVEVQPIITIGGDHEVNQVFFDNVRVPVGNRIGAEGEGWAIAKHLLSIERANSGNAAGRLRFHFADLMRVLKEEGALTDLRVRQRLARIAVDIDSVEMLELMLMFARQNGDNAGAITSVVKLRATLVEQDFCELGLHAIGEKALRWRDERPLHELEEDDGDLQRLGIAPRYLNSRIRSIFGGASEIQKSIIAASPLR